MAENIIPSQEELLQCEKENPMFHALDVAAILRVVWAGDEARSAMFDGPVRRYDISRGKFSVLLVLYHRNKDIAPSDMARITNMTRASISKVLVQMKDEGLVKEYIDLKDGRQRRIGLTEAGRERIEEILPMHYQRVNRLMSRLTDEEKKTLIALLSRLTD